VNSDPKLNESKTTT